MRLDDPHTSAARGTLGKRLEDRLTEGYARGHELEAECARIVRRITVLAASGTDDSAEMRSLAARLAEAQAELGDLRRELDEIRRRADPSGTLY